MTVRIPTTVLQPFSRNVSSTVNMSPQISEDDKTSLEIQDCLQMTPIQSSDVIDKNEDGSDITQARWCCRTSPDYFELSWVQRWFVMSWVEYNHFVCTWLNSIVSLVRPVFFFWEKSLCLFFGGGEVMWKEKGEPVGGKVWGRIPKKKTVQSSITSMGFPLLQKPGEMCPGRQIGDNGQQACVQTLCPRYHGQVLCNVPWQELGKQKRLFQQSRQPRPLGPGLGRRWVN